MGDACAGVDSALPLRTDAGVSGPPQGVDDRLTGPGVLAALRGMVSHPNTRACVAAFLL